MRSSLVVIAPPSPVVTILRGWKLRQPISAERAARATAPPRAERARGVLDQRQIGQLLDPRRAAEQVHRHDRLRARPDLDPRRVEVHRLRVDVDEHRLQPRERDDVRRRREGVGGHEHLVAGLQLEREHREVQRRRARRDRDRVLDLARPRQLAPRTRPTSAPIVSMPLSSTSRTASSSSAPTSGRARRMRAASPCTKRSSVRGRRRARPAAASRAARPPSRRWGCAARRRPSRSA